MNRGEYLAHQARTGLLQLLVLEQLQVDPGAAVILGFPCEPLLGPGAPLLLLAID